MVFAKTCETLRFSPTFFDEKILVVSHENYFAFLVFQISVLFAVLVQRKSQHGAKYMVPIQYFKVCHI